MLKGAYCIPAALMVKHSGAAVVPQAARNCDCNTSE